MTQYNPNPKCTANLSGYVIPSGVTATATSEGMRIQKAAGQTGKIIQFPTMSFPSGGANICFSGIKIRRNTAASSFGFEYGARSSGYLFFWMPLSTQAKVGTFVRLGRAAFTLFNPVASGDRIEIQLPDGAVDFTIGDLEVYDVPSAPASAAVDSGDVGIDFAIPTNSLTVTASHNALNDEEIGFVSFNWGDGSPNTSLPPVTTAAGLGTKAHTFPTAGIYTVTATGSGGAGSFARAYSVSVPSGTFDAAFTAETDFLSVNVDASSSIAPSLAPIDTYAWNWGDSTTTAASASKYASHTYTAPGTYNITLTIHTASVSRTDTEVKAVAIVAPPNPDNYFVASKDLLKVAFVPSIQSGTSYAWNFGDGSTSSIKEPVHTYEQPGTYAVSLTVNGSLTATQDVTVTDVYAPLGSLLDALRLEVSIPYPAGTIYNRLPNPSGDLGAWGWLTPVSNSYLTGSTTTEQTADKGVPGAKLIYRSSGAGSQVVYSQPAKVVAGQYAAAQLQCPYVDGYYRATVEALDAAGAVLGSSATTGFQTASATATVRTTAYLLPTGTAYARVRLNHYSNTSSGTPVLGALFHFRRVMLATASTSGALTSLPYAEYNDWQDLLAPTANINVSRAALDVGTLSATILDSTFDPATNGTIRPGQAVRLRAKTQDAAGNVRWTSIFTGTVNEADVEYVAVKGGEPGPKATKIKLSASDAVTALTRVGEPRGVAKIAELPEILEGAGVPFEINGSSAQVPTAQIVSFNTNASALDQIAITRDTDAGYAFVDRDNVLQAREPAYMPTVAVGVIDERAFSEVAASFNTGECINSVTIKWLRYTPASGEEEAKVEEITYGPFEDLESIAEWGLRPATFTMQGVENPTAIAAKGAAILVTNAAPARMITAVTLPIRYQEDLTPGKALLDLYDLVRLGYERTGTDELARVTSIEHRISPSSWRAKLGFSPNGTVAPPQTVASPPAATSAGSGAVEPVDMYDGVAACTTALPLTATETDIAGATLTVPAAGPSSTFLVIAGFDMHSLGTTSTTGACLLHVDGVAQAGNVIWSTAGVNGLRGTAGQNWIIKGLSAGSHVFKLRGIRSGGADGQVRVNQTHTRLVVVQVS